MARHETLVTEAERLEAARFEPWFPDVAIEAIRQVVGNIAAFASLLEDLFSALRRLEEWRERARVGDPALTAEQRQDLSQLDSAITAFLVACKDVEATKRLIGGWAEAGILQGSTLPELVSSMAVLSAEVAARLAKPPRARHRPTDSPLLRFYADVVAAMQSAGLDVPKTRGGLPERLIRTLLSFTDEQQVPKDLFRPLVRAISAADARARHATSARRILDVRPSTPKRHAAKVQ